MKAQNLEYALSYAKKGLYVFPCHTIRDGKCSCREGISCSKPGKHPMTPNGFKDATTDENLIRKYWTENPDANIGCATGAGSGIVVLDIDAKEDRNSSEFQIPPTVSVKTGGGGEHYFFLHPGGHIKSSNGQLFGAGVDIKADGGYVILAPSLHVSGNYYEWVIPFESKDELAQMPVWLKEAIGNNQKEKEQGDKLWQKNPGEVVSGTRNETAASMAGKILTSLPSELHETIGWSGFSDWNKSIPKPLSQTELRAVWESIKKYDNEEPKEKSKKESQADILIQDILSRNDVSLFHDEQGNGYVSMKVEGHQETWACNSKKVKLWLANEIYKKLNKVPTSDVKKNIVSVLEGKAYFTGPEIKLQNRVAWHDDALWYDLANKDWEAIKITREGWSIESNPPIIFNRYSHNKEQVRPSTKGDAKLFLKYVNIANPDHSLLTMVYIISCFISGFPHVMFALFGAQGSAKSTFSRLIRMIIDPSLIDVVSFPQSLKELIQTLAHNHFLFFDNVSYINEEQSDILCRAVTGGGHVKRELYENDEDIIYNFMRCVGLNGINLVTTRPDLLERSLLIELERIEPTERKTEKELYKSFEEDLPVILGGIFDVLVEALKIQPTVELEEHPRMADWTIWGCAIAEALGYTQEEFLTAYKNNIIRQTETLLSDNPIANALAIFMEDKNVWEGACTDLLLQLCSLASFAEIDTREKYWPKGAQALSRKLNELKTPLKEMGFHITNSTNGLQRFVRIEKLSSTAK